jgi:outer membrane protein assembly factor BamD (BamD/ComL family)
MVKYQLPASKYKNLSVAQMEYMIDKLNYTDENVKVVYGNALNIE